MSRPLVITLLALLFLAASAALFTGVQEARLARMGQRSDYAAEELAPGTRGYVAVFGCVRHDLAVATTADGRVYKLGTSEAGATDEDRVFTPMSARSDCDEGRAPARIYALVEDDEALSNTIGRVYKSRVAPPPVPAFVEGVIGFGAGSTSLGRHAAQALGVDLGTVPLVGNLSALGRIGVTSTRPERVSRTASSPSMPASSSNLSAACTTGAAEA